MERGKAILAAGITAASLTIGGLAFAAGSGLLASNPDNVGNLRPVATQLPVDAPQEITIYVDPVTGTATTVAPPLTSPAPVDSAGSSPLATQSSSARPAAPADDNVNERVEHEEQRDDD